MKRNIQLTLYEKNFQKRCQERKLLRMLKDKEEGKKGNEIAEKKRKEEGLFKKAQKQEEKERKRIAREEKN